MKLGDFLEILGEPVKDVYGIWFQELLRIAFLMGFSKKAIKSFDPESWREYYDDGLSPSEAMIEDLSQGL